MRKATLICGRYLLGSLLVVLVAAAGLAVSVIRAGGDHQQARSDAIVVLGAAQYNGKPSAVYAARLDHAADLYRSGVAPLVVTVGGGQIGDRVSEAQAGKDYLAAAGLPTDALLAVGTGDDTLASLRAAEAVMKPRGLVSGVLVTDRWHSYRSRLIASDLGFQVQISPVTDGPSTAPGVEGRYVFRETLGTLFYLLTGGSSGPGSAVM